MHAADIGPKPRYSKARFEGGNRDLPQPDDHVDAGVRYRGVRYRTDLAAAQAQNTFIGGTVVSQPSTNRKALTCP